MTSHDMLFVGGYSRGDGTADHLHHQGRHPSISQCSHIHSSRYMLMVIDDGGHGGHDDDDDMMYI